MSSRRKITITADDRLVVVSGYKVAEVARAAGLRPTYSASAGGWMLDLARLPDLVSWLEYRNIRYELEDGSAGLPVPHRDEYLDVDLPDTELDLFGQVVA